MRILPHIDVLAREKNRDVFYLSFYSLLDTLEASKRGIEVISHRPKIIKWLDENNIAHRDCFDIADEGGFSEYRGQLYIDILHTENDDDANYLKFAEFLEDKNGNIKPEFGTTKFWLVTLDQANKNKHHDTPGFWENWVENF